MKAGATSGGGRSEGEKEKTKLRERQRRAITTKIFHGLRKWGGYHLSPRADINEVLRQLAKEAGWVVEPDGTTYRARLPMNQCHVCGGATPTTSSSVVIGGGGSRGDSSNTASPRRVSLGGEPISNANTNSSNVAAGGFSTLPFFSTDFPLALYICGSGLTRGPHSSTTSSIATTTTASSAAHSGVPAAVTLAMQHQQQQFYNLLEVKASNQNTPVSSPLRRLT